jgi:hypothetical protein
MDAARLFLGDALEEALGAGALDVGADAGISGLEALAEHRAHLQVERGVEHRLAFLRRRGDQLRRHRRGRRRLGARRRRSDQRDRRGGQTRASSREASSAAV